MVLHWIWFAQLRGISLRVKKQLLEQFRDPEELFCTAPEALPDWLSSNQRQALENRDLSQAQAIREDCRQKGIRILGFTDAAYPSRLRSLEDPPVLLYCKGTIPDWDAQPVIGIVGTRRATTYGLTTAAAFARHIAACGGLVISGGADGIDGAAMQGALEAGKPTVGVLGCGVDVVYPKKNRALFELTEQSGCLISEYPPETPGLSWHFLERNRIISGIANGLLVVEAPAKSGALNTAQHAWEQGRDVFAVPANVGQESCAGSNALLEEKAIAALSGWSVVKHYERLYPHSVAFREAPESRGLPGLQEPKLTSQSGKNGKVRPKADKISIDKEEKSAYSVLNIVGSALSEQEQAVLNCVGPEPQILDAVIARTDLSPSGVKSILTRLALKGLVVWHDGGRVSRK